MTNSNEPQEQILQILKYSWLDLKQYYEKEIERYSQSKIEGYMVCWKEDDIVLQLGRFFYRRLEKSDFKDKSVELHTQTKVSNNTFKEEYSFHGKPLDDIKSKFGRVLKPDFIITKEDDNNALWLIGEVKYLREWRSALKNRVDKDLDELVEFKEKGVCFKTVYLVADDFLHRENKKRWLELQEQLRNEKAKSIDFIDLMIMCQRRDCTDKHFVFNSTMKKV